MLCVVADSPRRVASLLSARPRAISVEPSDGPVRGTILLLVAIQICNVLNGMKLAYIETDHFMEGSCVQRFCRHQCGTL